MYFCCTTTRRPGRNSARNRCLDKWRNTQPGESSLFVVGGAGLERNTGLVIRKNGAAVNTADGPLKESTEAMGGYYTIEAANYEDAVELTLDNPHPGFGTVEIRQVMVYNT